MAHLIGWKYSTESSPAEEEDLYLLNGVHSTEWICERFTKTYLDEWSVDSLMWEIAYISEPSKVSALANFDPTLFEERRVPLDEVGRALAHRLCTPLDPFNVEMAKRRDAARERVLHALDDGDMARALICAEENVAKYPNEAMLRRDLGFCLIGTQPHRALATLERHRPTGLDNFHTMVHHFNLVAAAVRCGNKIDIESYLSLLDPDAETNTSQTLWMWDPETLLNSPRVKACTLGDWRKEMLGVLSDIEGFA